MVQDYVMEGKACMVYYISYKQQSVCVTSISSQLLLGILNT